MRKIDFSVLPKKISDKRSKGKLIDWNKSVGYKLKFIYDDIEGEMKIIKYDGKKAVYIFIDGYTSTEGYRILTCHLLKNKIKGILKKKTAEYRFNVGDIVKTNKNEFLILEQIRIGNNMKGYLCECQSCREKISIDEYQLLKGEVGCYICNIGVKEIRQGVNDVATTRPDLLKYFNNKDDAMKISFGSNKVIEVKCPDCGNIRKIKMITLSSFGFSCSKCGDKKSFGSKFVFNLLNQSGVCFEQEKMFKWSDSNSEIGKKLYDFYIPSLNMIIEVHGYQHYSYTNRGRSLEDEQENDRLKEELARKNGIENYVIINAKYSTLKWLRESIRISGLPKYNEFQNIDYIECAEFSSNSLVKIASELWNNNSEYTTADIGLILKLTPQSVSRYLQLGSEIGFCDYTIEKGKLRASLKCKGQNHHCYNKKGINAYRTSPCKVIYPNGEIHIYSTAKECKRDIPESVYKKCIKGNVYKSNVKKLNKYNGIIIKKIEEGVA